MDENEVIDQSPLAQMAQATASPQVEQAAPKSAIAATAQPSEYEKATAEYRRQQQQLIERQKELIDSLSIRIQPSDYLSAMSQGFGDPRNLSFASGIAGAAGGVSALQAAEQKRSQELAKMKMELGMQELGMQKENIELAKNQDLRKAIGQMISGQRPGGVSGYVSGGAQAQTGLVPQSVAPILSVMAEMHPENALKYIADLAKDDAKRPDAIKALESYIEMLPPEIRDQARRAAASLNVFGKPSEIVDARLKVYDRLRNNDITYQQAQDELARLSPPTAGARPPESAAGVPAAAQSSTSGQVNISPRAREDVEQTRQEEEIKAQAAAREQAYKKLDELLRDSEAKASSAASTINSLDRFLESSPSAAAGGLQPLFTNVKNLLSSFGISPDSLVNEQKMSAAIDQILMGKMESMGSAARGLTDRDMESLRNSLPRINTDRRAREEVARIVKKSKAYDIEDYRIQRISESENFPDIARVRPAPRFYLDWIKRTKDFDQLKRQYSTSTTKEAKDDVMQRFDRYYGVGVARQVLR
jgi:hypothetical protein